MHGFEQIFFPAENLSSLKYTKYFSVLKIHLQEKILSSKLQSTSKVKILLQDEEENHGKADACRGFLMKYCGKRYALKHINPYVSPPL